MTRVSMIKESLEELMKNRVVMRIQAQRVDLMIHLLTEELKKCEAPTETTYGEPLSEPVILPDGSAFCVD